VKITKKVRWWLIAGAVLGFFRGVGALRERAGPPALSSLFETAGGFFELWLLVSAVLIVLWLWRRLTYRIWVRLFFSYLLIGVMPFVVLALLGSLALYMLMGQYTSVRWGDQIQLTQDRIARRCRTALEMGSRDGPEKMIHWLEELEKDPPKPLLKLLWVAQDGARAVRSQGADELFIPDWLAAGPPERLLAFRGDVPYLLVMGRNGSRAVLLGVRLDDAFARHLNETGWFDVYFYVSREGLLHGSPTVTVRQGKGNKHGQIFIQSHPVNVEDVWGPWPQAKDRGWLERPLVAWFRMAGRIVDLETGKRPKSPALITLLRTSPAAVWRDFVRAPFALGDQIRNALTGTALVLGILYLMVVGIAALMILAITRAVARLSRGAKEISRGNLGHRIPVKRHDQLGDLAVSFNSMAASVQRMLEEVREKERLAHELELARQIQENLLPSRRMRVGDLEVRASFRPAAEVGGDYFDVLAPDAGRVIVAVGDVAGHGLGTGLFMATVKSAVAAFVGEGYRGSGLLERLQELMLQANRQNRQPMVTLAVAEIDTGERTVRVASAGHPPAYVVQPDGTVEEVLLGSMPLGFPRCRPRERTLPFEPGSVLVLYSDGLVEATNARAEVLGYPALERIVQGSGRSPDVLLARIEHALEEHVQGRPLADDVTIVVVGSAGGDDVPGG